MLDTAKVSIKIELFGIGVLKGIIIRHIAPRSADAIIEKLPIILRGRFSFGSKNYWTLPGVKIYKGPNLTKAKREVEKGDMIYNPKSDELTIILEDNELPNRVNLIGKITANLDLVLKARNGLKTKITLE